MNLLDDLIDYQARHPVWYILRDPTWVSLDGAQQLWCGTLFEHRVLGNAVPGGCDAEVCTTILADCRTCGERPFQVCGLEIDDLMAGVTHTRPWCVYCTEATYRHEVLAIRRASLPGSAS